MIASRNAKTAKLARRVVRKRGCLFVTRDDENQGPSAAEQNRHAVKSFGYTGAMSNKESELLRKQLLQALQGEQTHLDFSSAVEGFPVELRGVKPSGAPHTAWQLLEHMRIAQRDILEFSRNPKHKSPEFPEGYWPHTEAPPDSQAWDAAVLAFQKDAREFADLIRDTRQDLFLPFAHGDGQTLSREALVLAAHNSYHLGQLVFLKKTHDGTTQRS
jgi:hypothetical protein